MLDDLWLAESTIAAVQPACHCVLLHIGGSDLSRLSEFREGKSKTMAASAVELAAQMSKSYGVSKVVLLSTLPQTRGLSGGPESFLLNMKTFNTQLEVWSRPLDDVMYVQIGGFYNVKVNNEDIPRPVSDWSVDGIHCDERSMPKYLQRVLFTIMRATSS